MTKHQKEKQRYAAKWLLLGLLTIMIISGIAGYFMEIKDSSILLVMLAEIVSLLGLFFGFHMKTKVSEEGNNGA